MRDLINLLESFGTPRIGLVGDFMLDRYVFGDAERMSPEAPVPVLRSVRSEVRLGAAGNVADAIAALGGECTCLGVIGDDAAGGQLNSLLAASGAELSGLQRSKERPTTVKTRFVGLAQHRHAQQMFRVDEETTEPLDGRCEKALLKAVGDLARAGCSVLAVEDYDKGVLTDTGTPQLIAAARKAGLAVLVDPARIADYRRYRGATLLTPNRYEASLASGIEINSDESLATAAQAIIDVAEAEAVVITLDKQGIYLHTRDGQAQLVPTRPRSVYDVSGAGDEVLAMLTVALACKADLPDAVALANEAGGLEVERFGVVAIKKSEIIDEMRRVLGQRGGKVLERQKLADELARRRGRGETIVFTNGCFDLLHMGHVRYLQQARNLGSCLIVAINDDESVRRLKGAGRPVVNAADRAELLAAMECVDYVTIFHEDTAAELITLLRPELQVKGGTTPVVVERELVESYGGKVVTLPAVAGLSTTEIISRIKNGGR